MKNAAAGLVVGRAAVSHDLAQLTETAQDRNRHLCVRVPGAMPRIPIAVRQYRGAGEIGQSC